MKNLSEIAFKNEFVNQFPGDDSGNLTPRPTPGVLYSKAIPTPVKGPSLLAWSEELGKELGIQKPIDQTDIDILGGNLVTSSMYPYAANYAGHQFGHWAGQLGDGRAITLGEVIATNGLPYEIQLKGAGPTAYSRRADGRAVLRSSVREYLMSEAMYYLGVPTTRALSLISTGDPVLRDMFYNGNEAYEPGAIVTRVAPTFIRFGNFEILAARQEKENLLGLINWTIDRYYPHIQGDDRIIAWYKEVVERTAKLMVEWTRVGFVHGVMNTDNMSILGLTIDYGPYSFMDDYDPNFTPNTTDLPGRRYAFGKQAGIGKWNLACLAGAIAPAFTDTTPLSAALESYDDTYWMYYYGMMTNKLGLDALFEEDIVLIRQLEKVLIDLKPDMTIFFQLLIDLPSTLHTEQDILDHFKESFYQEPEAQQATDIYQWMNDYLERLEKNTISTEERIKLMRATNPRFILRNYLLHQAIQELENGENTLFSKLQEAIKDPYSNKYAEFFVKRPDWATQQAGCSMLSCSS